MKYFVLVLAAFMMISQAQAASEITSTGESEVSVAGDKKDSDSYIQVSGDSAKALYDALTMKAEPDPRMVNTWVKAGRSYWCALEDKKLDTLYYCTVVIQNPGTGLISTRE